MKPEEMLLRGPSSGDHPERYFPGDNERDITGIAGLPAQFEGDDRHETGAVFEDQSPSEPEGLTLG